MHAIADRNACWDRQRLMLTLQLMTLVAILLGDGYSAVRLLGG